MCLSRCVTCSITNSHTHCTSYNIKYMYTPVYTIYVICTHVHMYTCMYMYHNRLWINTWKCVSWFVRCPDLRRHTNMAFEAVILFIVVSMSIFDNIHRRSAPIFVSVWSNTCPIMITLTSIHVYTVNTECRKHRGMFIPSNTSNHTFTH